MTPGSPSDKDFPYWLVVAGAIAVYLIFRVVSDDLYSQVLGTLSKGIWITLFVTFVAFILASLTCAAGWLAGVYALKHPFRNEVLIFVRTLKNIMQPKYPARANDTRRQEPALRKSRQIPDQ